jgi:hypothetical protein
MPISHVIPISKLAVPCINTYESSYKIRVQFSFTEGEQLSVFIKEKMVKIFVFCIAVLTYVSSSYGNVAAPRSKFASFNPKSNLVMKILNLKFKRLVGVEYLLTNRWWSTSLFKKIASGNSRQKRIAFCYSLWLMGTWKKPKNSFR